MFPLSLSHRAFEWIALLRLIFFRELRENMSLSNKKNKLLDESEIKEKIHFIENNFLNFDSKSGNILMSVFADNIPGTFSKTKKLGENSSKKFK